MVAADGLADLAHRRAAELAAPDDQRVVEQARDSSGPGSGPRRAGRSRGRPGRGRGSRVWPGYAVMVPVGVIELDEPHPALDQPPGQQAVVGEATACPARRRRASASRRSPSRRSISSGALDLHPEGHLVGVDPGRDLGVGGGVEPWHRFSAAIASIARRWRPARSRPAWSGSGSARRRPRSGTPW